MGGRYGANDDDLTNERIAARNGYTLARCLRHQHSRQRQDRRQATSRRRGMEPSQHRGRCMSRSTHDTPLTFHDRAIEQAYDLWPPARGRRTDGTARRSSGTIRDDRACARSEHRVQDRDSRLRLDRGAEFRAAARSAGADRLLPCGIRSRAADPHQHRRLAVPTTGGQIVIFLLLGLPGLTWLYVRERHQPRWARSVPRETAEFVTISTITDVAGLGLSLWLWETAQQF